MPRPESSDLRIRGANLINEFVQDASARKSLGIPVKGNEPKMALRTLRSVLLTPDRYNEILEEALTNNWSPEQLKNKVRTMMERHFPKTQRVLETDRIHHASAPDMWTRIINRAMDAERPDMIVDAVDAANREGLKLGDTIESTAGASLDERAHTGARPKQSQTKFVAPAEYGPPGKKELSAHPRGTRADKQLAIPDKAYGTSSEVLDAARPRIQLANEDTQIGIKADQTRRNFINETAIKRGVLPEGTNVFGRNVTPQQVQQVQTLFKKNPSLSIGAAEAFNPNGGFVNSAVLDVAGDFIKRNAKGEALGAGYGLFLDPRNREAVEKGDVKSIVRNTAVDSVVGGVVQSLSSGVARIAPRLAPALSQLSVAAPIALLNTALDPGANGGLTNTQRQNVNALNRGDPLAISHAQHVPQAYGKSGPTNRNFSLPTPTKPEPKPTVKPKYQQNRQSLYTSRPPTKSFDPINELKWGWKLLTGQN